MKKQEIKAPFVGQVLYREVKNELRAYVVSKIGKKYLYLEGAERYPININTLEYIDKNYTQSSFKLNADKQVILDGKEKSILLDKLQKHFNWMGEGKNSTLEQLRAVVELLNL